MMWEILTFVFFIQILFEAYLFFSGEEPFQEYSDLPTFQRDVHWQGKRLPLPDTWPEDVLSSFSNIFRFYSFYFVAQETYHFDVGRKPG